MIGRLLSNEVERISNGAVVALSRYHPGIYLKEVRKTTRETSFRTTGAPAEIRNENLANTSLECYR
jgi:hypothetical protein